MNGVGSIEVDYLKAEIERLRAEAAQAEQNWAADWKHEFDNLRSKVIEECARVAEGSVLGFRYPDVCEEIATAIRALKDKP